MGGVLLKAKVEAKNVLEKGSEGLNGLNSFADNKIGWFKGKLGELGDLLLFVQKTIILQIKFLCPPCPEQEERGIGLRGEEKDGTEEE